MTALFAAFALSDWNFTGSLFRAIAFAALLVIYAAILLQMHMGWRPVPLVSIEEVIIPLSLRLVALLSAALVIQVYAYGIPDITSTLFLSFAKVMAWYSIIRIVCICLPRKPTI